MSDDNHILLRQAYMDNQLSLSEITDFEESLDPNAGREIEQDKQFEAALVANLGDVRCPDALWDEICTHLSTQSNRRGWFLVVLRAHWRQVAACIAVIAGCAGMWMIRSVGDSRDAPPISLAFSTDLHEFSRDAEIPGDYDKVRGSLIANNLHVKLSPPVPGGHHAIRLLGVRFHVVDGSAVAQLYFSCCGEPISAFVCDRRTDVLGDRIGLPKGGGKLYSVTHEIDNYRIYVAGPHPPADILDLFS